MGLSDLEILEEMMKDNIVVRPFRSVRMFRDSLIPRRTRYYDTFEAMRKDYISEIIGDSPVIDKDAFEVELRDCILSDYERGGLRFPTLGSNSVDLHLSRTAILLSLGGGDDERKIHILGDEEEYEVVPPIVIDGQGGFVLSPGQLYLGATEEYTESNGLKPQIDGRSSIGRLGISIHRNVGFGDIGFKNHWTLSMDSLSRVFMQRGARIAQISYDRCGRCAFPYGSRKGSKYTTVSPSPVGSLYHIGAEATHGRDL